VPGNFPGFGVANVPIFDVARNLTSPASREINSAVYGALPTMARQFNGNK
jgi:hypothetical protein